jgi:hypothetical protein
LHDHFHQRQDKGLPAPLERLKMSVEKLPSRVCGTSGVTAATRV